MYSERIKSIRKALNLTLKELAADLGVPERTAASYEAGRDPSISFARNICLKYGINAGWFLTGRGCMFNENSSAEHIDDFTQQVIELLRRKGLI